MFEDTFGPMGVTTEAHGNVLVALSFLHGLAVQELRKEELDFRDRQYEVLITLRALKREGSDEPTQP